MTRDVSLRAMAAFALAAMLAGVPGVARAIGDLPGIGAFGGKAEGDEVKIDAAEITYDQKTNVVTAKGAVKITRGEMVLTADTVRVNRTTEVAEAEGNVVMNDPEGTLTADALSLNLTEETGSLDEGTVFLEKNRYQLSGEHFEKLPGQSYRVQGGRFTTCLCSDGSPPSWSVRGEQISLDLEGYGRVSGGTFEVMDYPVFYIPYGIFPLKRERQSGFLTPRFGYSNRRGFQYLQPFYWAINKSMDATLSLDVETAARIGAIAEYRYALSPQTLGEAQGMYFNEQIRGASSDDVVNTDIADPHVPLNRWAAALTHDQWLPLGMRGFADVFRVSDDLFLREINVFSFNPGVDTALRTRRYERSRVGVLREFKNALVVADSVWYQDFINPERFVFQTPPKIETVVQQRLLDDWLLVHFNGSGTNFDRREGFDGQRLDLLPELELPFRYGSYAFGSARAGFRETAYHLDNTSVPTQPNTNPADPGDQPPNIFDLQDDAHREVFYLGGEVGTSLSRIIPFHRFGISRLKHTIEPVARYLFVPKTSVSQDTLPLYDEVDRIGQRSVFTYGMMSRLLARFDLPGVGASVDEGEVPEFGDRAAARGPIREIGRFGIFNSYDLAHKGGNFVDQVDPDTGEPISGDATRVSDLALYLRLTPSEFLTFEGQTDYNLTGEGAKGARVGMAVADPRTFEDDFLLSSLRNRTRLGVGYRFVADNSIKEVNGSVLLRLSKRFYVAYETRYDALRKRFLENRYGLRVLSDCECWVLDVGVSDQINPDETTVRVLLSLVGLGSFGQAPFRQSLGGIAAPAGGFLDPASR